MQAHQLVDTRGRPLHGHAKLELIRPDTGRSIKVAEAENYISDALLNHNRWRQRQEYRNTISSTDAELYANLMERAILTDSGVGQSGGDVFAPGLVTAWASPGSSAADASRKGSLTSGQSSASATQAVYVFEWPTTVGNGIIRSVQWGPVGDGASIVAAGSFTGGLPNNSSGKAVGCWYDGAGGMWLGVAGSLVKYAWEPTRAGVAAPSLSFTGPTETQMGITNLLDIVGDGTNLYAVGSGATTIRKFTTPTGSGDVTESAITVSGVSPSTITYDGAYLWVGFASGNVYRVDKSSGAIERSFSIAWSGQTPRSICWYPPKNLLLVAYSSGISTFRIRAFDLDGVVRGQWAISSSGTTSSDPTVGLTYVGTVVDSLNPGFTYEGILLRDSATAVAFVAPGLVAPLGPCATFATLGTEVEKTSLTAMKLTYTFTFS